jgi:hypothetical protein
MKATGLWQWGNAYERNSIDNLIIKRNSNAHWFTADINHVGQWCLVCVWVSGFNDNNDNGINMGQMDMKTISDKNMGRAGVICGMIALVIAVWIDQMWFYAALGLTAAVCVWSTSKQ